MDVAKRLLSRTANRTKRSMRHTPDYRKKLEAPAPSGGAASPPASNGPSVAEPSAMSLIQPADVVRRMQDHEAAPSLGFQSVAVAAVQTLRTVRAAEAHAANAAISLAQQERLREMVAMLDETTKALNDILTSQGARMLAMGAEQTGEVKAGNSWKEAVHNAQQISLRSANWLRAVVGGQPDGCAIRRLSETVTTLLHAHAETFAAEADSCFD